MGASHFIVALPINRKYPIYAPTQKYASNDAVNDADAAEARGTTEGNGENGDREPGKGKKEKKKKKKKNKHDGILPIKLILVLLYATLDGRFLT
ncbi:tRNA-dihydrouridine synthase 3 [Fusarium oxysporum]|nr:tRNA-dihydrouridine synthase 3 [Fusarium oxysporum]KAJ4239214.1 tRNA-dihydrouridine synthase 3 [Fusarium oxysporum]